MIDSNFSDMLLVDSRTKTVGYKLSRILSILFHPFIIPTYSTIILLLSSSLIVVISPELKLYFIALITLNTLFLPIFILLLMRYTGVIKSLELPTRRNRILPLVVVGMCYVLCIVLMPASIVSFLINKFLFASIGCIISAFCINLFWKISLHLLAMGCISAMLIYSYMYIYGVPVWLLIFVIMVTGSLAAARLYVGAHNLRQVTVGYIVGFVVSIIVMYF